MGKHTSLFAACGLLLLVSCTPVYADSVYVGGWSKHINSDIPENYELNEDHSLLAVEYHNTVVGHFYNSYYDSTWFASRRYSVAKIGDIRIRLHAGITYGYKSCEFTKPDALVGGPAVYCPMIVPEISYDKYRVRPTFMIVGNAFVVTFKINLGG